MSADTKHNSYIDARVLEVQARKAEQEHNIFLAGPFIDLSKKKKDPVNLSTTASAARFAAHEFLTARGSIVILGEHKRLEQLGAEKFGEQNNAVLFERNIIVNKKIDAVIIFPSSPGSFLEFGDWANDPKIGAKMLVLLDKKYETHENYLNLGPARLAKDVGATVEYVEYEKHDLINRSIDMFLKKVSAKQYREEIYGRV